MAGASGGYTVPHMGADRMSGLTSNHSENVRV